MGLKQDLLDAKVEALKLAGAPEPIPTEALELQIELETEALMKFLTTCQFRITGLAAPVVLEDFKIPPQQGDVLSSVTSTGIGNAGAPVTSNVVNGTNGLLTKNIDVDKVGGVTGLLESTGYAFIGGDPDSQGGFDVSDQDGVRDFTSVELFREDIEDLL